MRVAVYLPKKREEMEGRAGRQAGSRRPGIGSGGWGSWATLKREKGWPCQPRGLKDLSPKDNATATGTTTSTHDPPFSHASSVLG